MPEVHVESLDPLTGPEALAIAEQFKAIGHRVEIYTGITERLQGGEFFTMKVLIIEPIDGPQLMKMCRIAEDFGRPMRFNETEGFRVS